MEQITRRDVLTAAATVAAAAAVPVLPALPMVETCNECCQSACIYCDPDAAMIKSMRGLPAAVQRWKAHYAERGLV